MKFIIIGKDADEDISENKYTDVLSTTEQIKLLNEDIAGGSDVFLFIFLTDCPPCKMTKPEWDRTEQILNREYSKNNNLVVARVNSDLLSGLNNYGTAPAGFPSLRYISKNGIEEYNGERTTDAFVKWIKTKSHVGAKTQHVGGKHNKRHGRKSIISRKKNSKKNSRKNSKKISKKISKKNSRRNSKKISRRNSKKISKKISKKNSRKNSKKNSRRNSKKISKKNSIEKNSKKIRGIARGLIDDIKKLKTERQKFFDNGIYENQELTKINNKLDELDELYELDELEETLSNNEESLWSDNEKHNSPSTSPKSKKSTERSNWLSSIPSSYKNLKSYSSKSKYSDLPIELELNFKDDVSPITEPRFSISSLTDNSD